MSFIGHNTISAEAVLLTAGVITLVIAAVGICWAWSMWGPVLIIVSQPDHDRRNFLNITSYLLTLGAHAQRGLQ